MQIDEFKKAVGKFPTGVCVISTFSNNRLWGFTANSFVSVSLSPPLISFCLDQNSESFNAFSCAEYFSVNILGHDQENISKHFSYKSENKFLTIDYLPNYYMETPLIIGAASFLGCKKNQQIECGDHFIFVGDVQKTQIDNAKDPLVYFAKSYRAIK